MGGFAQRGETAKSPARVDAFVRRGVRGCLDLVAGERSHCRYANLSSYFVIPNLTPAAA